jgi:MFS family permease
VWHIYVSVALLGAGMAMNQPVRTAWVPQMVGQAQLINALSLNSVAINATRLIGPVLIGILIAVTDIGIAYIISAALYTLVILSTFLIKAPPAPAPKGRGSMIEQLLEGFRFMSQDRLVLLLVLIGLGPLAFAFSYMTLLPILATNVLGMGSGGFGALMSAGAVGGLIGGLTLASRSDLAHKGRLILVAGVGYGIVLILLGGIPWAIVVFPIIALAGACQTVFRTSSNAALLRLTPPSLQGRIISMTLLYSAMAPLAGVAAGFIADVVDVSAAMAVIGGVCIAIVVSVALLEPRIGRL